MDQPTNVESRANGAAPFNGALRRIISMPTSLPSRAALILAVALASVALFSIRYATHPPFRMQYGYRFDALRSWSNPFRSLGDHRRSNFGSAYMTNSRPMSHWRSLGSSRSRFSDHALARRSRTACGSVEDFVEDREVATGDCNGGRLCRARVIVTKAGSTISVQAGYNILYRGGAVIGVDKRTKRNVKAVKRSEANKWAKSLLSKIAPTLKDLDCEITAAMISDAIMGTKNDASRCPNTNNALCTSLITIKTCAAFEPLPVETTKQQECRAFLASDTAVSSLDDLVAKSPCEVHFEYNLVYVTVPFCKTMCATGGCASERVMYADLSVSGVQIARRWDGTDNERTRNSIATVFASLFNTLISPNLPGCDDMSYKSFKDEFSERREFLVATDDGTTDKSAWPYVIPQAIQDMAAENYGTVVLDARYYVPMSLASYIETQCAAVE